MTVDRARPRSRAAPARRTPKASATSTIVNADVLTVDFVGARAERVRCASSATCPTTSPRRCCSIASSTSTRSATCTSCCRRKSSNAWSRAPGSKVYGRLSVMLQLRLPRRAAAARAGRRIPSAAEGRIGRRAADAARRLPSVRPQTPDCWPTIVRAAFGQRRKTLSNALSGDRRCGGDRSLPASIRVHAPSNLRHRRSWHWRTSSDAPANRGLRRLRRERGGPAAPSRTETKTHPFTPRLPLFFQAPCPNAPPLAENPDMSGKKPYDIAISVDTRFLDDQSAPSDNRYAFAYTITIENRGTVGARLLSRHWVITDANGKVQRSARRRRGRRAALGAAGRRFRLHLRRRARDRGRHDARQLPDGRRRRHALRRADFRRSCCPCRGRCTDGNLGRSATSRAVTTNLSRLLEKINFDPAQRRTVVLRRPGQSRRAIARGAAPGASRSAIARSSCSAITICRCSRSPSASARIRRG